MQYKSRFQNFRWRTALLACLVGLGFVTVFRISSAARSEFGPTPQQDIIRLENRMTQLEQRLFTIDNSVRNLEQQSRLAGSTARGATAEDFARLRFELQALQQRLAEHECALAKLDERTLSAAMRAARRKGGANDPCRQNSETPLQNAQR
jgi:hypothetical protein